MINSPKDIESLIKLNWDSLTQNLVECNSPDIFLRQDMQSLFKDIRYMAWIKDLQIQDLYASFLDGVLQAQLVYILDTYTDKFGQLINPTGLSPWNGWASPHEPILTIERKVVILEYNMNVETKEHYTITRWDLELE